MIGPMLFSPMKVTLKFLIKRIESIFVDSVMIELDLNDHKSEFIKVVVLSMCHTYPSIYETYTLYKSKHFENTKYFFFDPVQGVYNFGNPCIFNRVGGKQYNLRDFDISLKSVLISTSKYYAPGYFLNISRTVIAKELQFSAFE